MQDSEVLCESENLFLDYFLDKTIVVFATESFIKEEDQEPNKNEVQSYMVPIAEKRLDYRAHKNIGAQIEEIYFEIQDMLIQIHNPEP